MERKELLAKIAEMEAKRGTVEFNEFKLNAWKTRLKELDEQEKFIQAQEEKLEEEISFNIPGVDMTRLPVEVIKLVEIIVRHDRARLIEETKEEYARLTSEFNEYRQGADEREAQLRRQNNELQLRHDEMAGELRELQAELEAKEERIKQLTYERDEMAEMKQDAEMKRDNAIRELDDARKEIARLESQIADYQKAKVWGEREAQKIIDIPAEEADDVQKLVDEIAERYIAADDTFGTLVKVTLEDGSTKVVKRSEFEKMQPVQPPEVGGSSFRDETQPESDRVSGEVDGTADQNVQQEGVNFRPAADDGLAQGNMGGTLADATLEERVAALEKRVTALEQRQGAAA